jgi:hypothetical protein
MSGTEKVKHFLYLDLPLVNSLFSQYHSGIITNITKGNSTEVSLSPKIGFDLVLVKGEIGTGDSDTSTSNETIDLHHYVYNLLEAELFSADDTGDIVMHKGTIRVIDSRIVSEQFENLKDLLSGFNAAMKISNIPEGEKLVIPKEITEITSKGKDIGKLIKQISSERILAYIGNKAIALDKDSVTSFTNPEFMNNGKLFGGEYVVVGIRSSTISDNAANGGDILISLSVAFSAMQDIIKIEPIKPIAIYRVIE